MEAFISQLKAKYDNYESKFNCNYSDYIDYIIKQDIKRDELLQLVQTFKPLSFEKIFPLSELSQDRFIHLDSGSFGNAFVLEKGRHRREVIVKYVRCIPASIHNNLTRHICAMNYDDIYNEIRCMQILNQLNKGFRKKITSNDNGRISHRYLLSKANCFPMLFDAYLCDSPRSAITLEPYFQFYNQYLYYPGFESVIVVMEHCGSLLLEMIKHNSINLAGLVSIVKQLILGLFVAECVFSYEHRDAHLGNILVQPTTERYIKFIYNSKVYSIPSFGYRLKIIDFTYSRICLNETSYFKDLSFMFDNTAPDGSDDDAVGQSYNFDGYTEMRRHLRDDWDKYSPKTNLSWVNHILKSILDLAKAKSFEITTTNPHLGKAQSSSKRNQNNNSNKNKVEVIDEETRSRRKVGDDDKGGNKKLAAISEVLSTKLLQHGGSEQPPKTADCHAYYSYLKLLLSISVKCHSLDELVRLLCSKKFNTIVKITF